jgi:predicted TIM-barrel fold metal-dependent hydrolase
MIIDMHAHVFPHLGGACGYKSVSEHLAYQRATLYKPQHPRVDSGVSPELKDINFRVGKFGRFEWTEDGVDYYRQFNPPSLEDQTASPEFMLAQMDHAGVDRAVLQNSPFYGELNNYFAECVKKYPDKFIGLVKINELKAYKKSEILKLRHAVNELKLEGIYFTARAFFSPGISGKYIDKKFDLFWQEVSNLGISVHWGLVTSKESAEEFLEEVRVLDVWGEKFPDIPSVITHGFFPIKPFMRNDEIVIPKEFLKLFKHRNISAEILYSVIAGPLGWDYPYPQAQKIIKNLYEEIGAEQLVWGTDMPVLECNCTYRQSLTYLRDYCDFISPKDMDLILGGNAIRMLKIEMGGPKTIRPIYAGGIY